MDTEQRAIEMRTWAPARSTTRGRIAAAFGLAAVAVWMWVAPPAFLAVAEAPPPSYERIEAGLRLAVALQSEKIERFRVENGRLPDHLREVGDAHPGLYYRRVDATTYRIHGVEDDTRILYEFGAQTMEALLKNSLVVLREER